MKSKLTMASAAISLSLISLPAAAQTGWTVSSDEYSCTAANNGPVVITSFRRGATGLSLTYYTQQPAILPPTPRVAVRLAAGAAPWDGFTLDAVSAAGAPPASPGSFRVNGPVSSALRDQLRARGGQFQIFWQDAAGAERGAADFAIPAIDAGLAALDACKAVVPPPNRTARPKAAISNWFQDAGLLDLGLPEGTRIAGFVGNLVISPQGRVTACEIGTSSGNDRADRLLCNAIKRRGRFVAATDAASNHIEARQPLAVPTLLIQE